MFAIDRCAFHATISHRFAFVWYAGRKMDAFKQIKQNNEMTTTATSTSTVAAATAATTAYSRSIYWKLIRCVTVWHIGISRAKRANIHFSKVINFWKAAMVILSGWTNFRFPFVHRSVLTSPCQNQIKSMPNTEGILIYTMVMTMAMHFVWQSVPSQCCSCCCQSSFSWRKNTRKNYMNKYAMHLYVCVRLSEWMSIIF